VIVGRLANAVISGSADFAQIRRDAARRGTRPASWYRGHINRPTIQIVLRKETAAAAGFDHGSPAQRAQLMRAHHRGRLDQLRHPCLCAAGAAGGLQLDEIASRRWRRTKDRGFQTRQVDGFAMSMPWPLQPVLEGARS
jgi:hypothetical protein